MTADEAEQKLIEHWLGMSAESLASARSELAAGRLHVAVNRAYYAAFYAANAALLAEGKKYAKHTAVRAAMHRDLVHTGRLELRFGSIYNDLMKQRERGDYVELVTFEADEVANLLSDATELVDQLRALLPEHD